MLSARSGAARGPTATCSTRCAPAWVSRIRWLPSALADQWPRATRKLLEDKANGPAVIDSLKHAVPGIIPVEPDGSKTAHAHAVTALFEAGHVHIPHPQHCAWASDYVAELTQFPGAAHDDQVDATTQAVCDMERKRGLNINAAILQQNWQPQAAFVGMGMYGLRPPFMPY